MVAQADRARDGGSVIERVRRHAQDSRQFLTLLWWRDFLAGEPAADNVLVYLHQSCHIGNRVACIKSKLVQLPHEKSISCRPI